MSRAHRWLHSVGFGMAGGPAVVEPPSAVLFMADRNRARAAARGRTTMMRALARVAPCLLLLASCATTARAQTASVGQQAASPQESASREALQKLYVTYLKSEGYSPEITATGDVTFKYQGGKYAIIIDPKDPTYFRLVYVWKIGPNPDRPKMLEAANRAEMGTKAAKVLITPETVIVADELFLKDSSDFSTVLARALSSVQFATRAYLEDMNKKS